MYGDHGKEEGLALNSGVALMSNFPLINFKQLEFNECDGIFNECAAAKGWVQATIVKDNFPIGLFNLHTGAGEESDEVATRHLQLMQLRNAVDTYRTANPDHIVFVMGDFNVYGERSEYYSNLIPQLGVGLGGRDADRNSPGFVFDSTQQWTLCDCNALATYFDSETVSGRLDYIFYFPSLDNTVEVIPLSVDVLQFTGRTLREDGLTTDQSSDHWGLHGRFQLVRP